MPKRNSTPHTRLAAKSPTPTSRSEPPSGQAKIRFRLVSVNESILPELWIHSPVVVKIGSPTLVSSPLGTKIGEISDSDAARLIDHTIGMATVQELKLSPPLVVIEVLLQ